MSDLDRGVVEFPPHASADELRKTCDELKEAIDDGKLGDIVAKHEALILKYYGDVRDQARQSFDAARAVAYKGFWVLIGTLLYVLTFDTLSRLQIVSTATLDTSMTAAKLGVVSGAFIEFIASINFWLYAKGAKQFGAFHVCLERTHRYLLAYKIAEELESNRNDALRDLMCIMANAPMISHVDAQSARLMSGTHVQSVAAELRS